MTDLPPGGDYVPDPPSVHVTPQDPDPGPTVPEPDPAVPYAYTPAVWHLGPNISETEVQINAARYARHTGQRQLVEREDGTRYEVTG